MRDVCSRVAAGEWHEGVRTVLRSLEFENRGLCLDEEHDGFILVLSPPGPRMALFLISGDTWKPHTLQEITRQWSWMGDC